MPRLLIRTPAGGELFVDLGTARLKIGRADTCDIVLRDDAEVSREHAEIWCDEASRILIADRNSKNGTRVDDGPIFRNESRAVRRNVRIGEHELRLLEPADADTPANVRYSEDPPLQLGDTKYFPSTRSLDLSTQRLNLLMSLTERIGGVFERKQLLEQALDACCDALGFERGLIALKTPRGETEHPVTRNIARDETGAFKVSRTLINRALLHGERAIVNNAATDLIGNLTESMVRYPICSALCVPILNRGEVLGVVYGDRVSQASTYQPEDVDFLAAIAQQVGVGLANLRMFQDHVKNQKLLAELDQARDIQRGLLPADPLVIESVRCEGFNHPSSGVSGDYFDYFPLDGDRVGFIIADVTGHGLPAAIIMANLQAAIRVALRAETSLARIAASVNELVCGNTGSHRFVTGVLGVIDVRTGALDYVNAGHPVPLRCRVGDVHMCEERGGLPFGVEPGEEYPVQHISRDENLCALLFYTDGFSEAANREGHILGVEPLTAALNAHQHFTCSGMIRTIRSVVRRQLDGQPPADDMTLLAITFGEPGSATD